MTRLFIGHQFRNAIARYYVTTRRYPRELADLLNEDTSVVPRHFLRKIYHDPMTGAAGRRRRDGRCKQLAG